MTFFFSSRFLTEEMASFLVCGGRALFFALLVTQNFMLAAYPATYKDDSTWYAVAASQALSVTIWLALVLSSAAKLQRLFYIWGLYIFGLVISIAIVFGFVGDILDKKRFLGPNVLKTVLCITPLLLLLLLNTAKDGKKYKEVVSKLSFYMTVDIFNSVEMLDIVLDKKRAQLWHSERIWSRNDPLGLHQFTALPMANGEKQSQGRKTQKMYCNITKHCRNSFRRCVPGRPSCDCI